MARRLRPSWFKAQSDWLRIFREYDSSDVGDAFLAALEYISTGKRPSGLRRDAEKALAAMEVEILASIDRYKLRVSQAEHARSSSARKNYKYYLGVEEVSEGRKEGSEGYRKYPSETDITPASVGDTFPGISDGSEEDEGKYVTYRQFLALKGGETSDGGRAEPPDGGV